MASRIVEFFGYAPLDASPVAMDARGRRWCPFIDAACSKSLRDGVASGVCTLKLVTSGPVICCPIRLYANDYVILRDVAHTAFGTSLPLVTAASLPSQQGPCIAVFGKRWGKELRLPKRGKSGAYFVDWVLARLDEDHKLLDFTAVEVQSIDTTGNYRGERDAYLAGHSFESSSTAGLNWENVNKRILPQLIYKGHVLRQEPLCQKGLFFVCPTPVYEKISTRLGGGLRPYPIQPGALTIMWYDIGPSTPAGKLRALNNVGHLTTTIDQVALAFTAPSNLPPAQVYESAIRAELT